VIKRIHQATLGVESSLAYIFFAIIVEEKKDEDEEKENEARICKSFQAIIGTESSSMGLY
jgi:hypothetical protein